MSARRDEIVVIAGELFADRGYSSTTVREIGERAGILSGSLYHHFDSKEAIAEEILAAYYRSMLEEFRRISATADDEATKLSNLVRTAYRGIADQPHAVALVANSGDQLLRLPRFAHLAGMNDELEQIWLKVIRAGHRKRIFRESTDPRLVYTFIRDAMWVTIRWWRPDGKYTIEQIADRYIDTIYQGILGPTAGPSNGAASSAAAASVASHQTTGRKRSRVPSPS